MSCRNSLNRLRGQGNGKIPYLSPFVPLAWQTCPSCESQPLVQISAICILQNTSCAWKKSYKHVILRALMIVDVGCLTLWELTSAFTFLSIRVCFWSHSVVFTYKQRIHVCNDSGYKLKSNREPGEHIQGERRRQKQRPPLSVWNGGKVSCKFCKKIYWCLHVANWHVAAAHTMTDLVRMLCVEPCL